MPFQSEKQRKYLWANEPEIARDWTENYGSRVKKDTGGITRIPFANGLDPDTQMNQMIPSQSNLLAVATGTGLHEQAMRDYLNPFSRNKNIQVGQGAVGDYMSDYLKSYIDPNNQAGGKFGERKGPDQMQVTGLGISPNPFSRTGIATAAKMAKDPSFQAENLFGEGTLTQVPGGYDYTGGKFDFNFPGPLEGAIFAPSTYGMKFDKDMNTLNQFDRDFRAFDQAKMGNLGSGNNVRGDATNKSLEEFIGNLMGYDYNDVDALTADEQAQFTADEQAQLSIDDLTPQRNIFGKAKDLASSGIVYAKSGAKFLGDMFRGSPEQRARNEANKRFGVGDIYGYGMGSASGANKDAFGYNTVSAKGNYEKHMRDTVARLQGRTFKPGSYQFNKFRDYSKNIATIDRPNEAAVAQANKVAAFQDQRAADTGAGSWGTGQEAESFGENIGSGGWDSYT